MRNRLVFALLCILALPMLFSDSKSGFVSPLAIAGHTVAGELCHCGCSGCLCDPGEQIENCDNLKQESPLDRPSDNPDRGTQPDAGPGLLIVALMFWLWIRLRA